MNESEVFIENRLDKYMKTLSENEQLIFIEKLGSVLDGLLSDYLDKLERSKKAK